MFRDRAFLRKLLFLAFPLTLQNLMLALVAAGDALMLGKLHQNAMAAVSLASQIQFVQNTLLGGIAAGMGVLGAQYWGKGDKQILGRLLGLGVTQATAVSILFFLGCYFLPEALMRLFAGDAELIALGADYLRVASWSYLLTGVSQCYLAILRVSGHATHSAWISATTVVLNIVLNAIFIFGLAGAPALGVKGAALATVLARLVELSWCLLSSLRPNYIRLKLKALVVFPKFLFFDFWKYTLPLLGAFTLWGTGFTTYTAILGHLGPDAAAANAIAAVIRDLLCCMASGFAMASGIVIGNELGAGHLETGRLYGDRMVRLSFLMGLICTACSLACIPLVNHFLPLTDTARHYTAGMLVILSIYMIGRTVCTVVINGIFDAGGDTMFDIVSLVIFMWCFALPCAFLGAFVLHLPVLAVYACTCLDEVGKVPWVILHHRKYRWVKNITREGA